LRIPFLGGAYEGRSPNVSPQQCMNFFYEKGKDGESLVSTAGDTTFNSDNSGEVRGGIAYNDLAYFVIGNTLYEFNSAGTDTNRGNLVTSNGPVSMAHNGVRTGANQQIMIVDGTTGYIYDNTTSTLTEIADTDMTAGVTVQFVDGYFAFNQKNTDRWWITSSFDGTAIAAADFFTAEGDPDILQCLVADQRQVFTFGKLTTQVYYNSGDADTTFEVFQGGHTQTGCVAPFSAVRFDNSVIWLSENERGDGQVVRLGDGYQPVVVSTQEVNYQISTYSKIDDAIAYSYQHEGHEFYVLTFPTANKTWVYDALTQEWHQRGHTINGEVGRERYNCHVFAFGEHLMGDMANGKIYKLDPETGTANGARIPRIRVSPSVTDEEGRRRISELQLDMQEGTGDPNSSTDTQIWLSYSKDGGHTYSDERDKSIGDAGEYDHRVIWRQLGVARNWIFRIRTWSPNKVFIQGLIARMYGESDGTR